MKSVYGYRIDNREISFFYRELTQGRLRQGWGYNPGQDLRKRIDNWNLPFDEGACGNIVMLEVKKDDILLIPHLPEWSFVTIAQATEDWNTGYRFEIDAEHNDYGHIFPAKIITSFQRDAKAVNAAIRSTLRNPRRFWKCDVSVDDVLAIINAAPMDIVGSIDSVKRINDGIEDLFYGIFDDEKFSTDLFTRCINQTRASEWETLLVYVLKTLFPSYDIVHVGGVEEVNHGSDILIYIPGLTSTRDYVIAIQVKDYQGSTDDRAIKQICKADNYNFEGAKLIEKVVIYTKIQRNDKLTKEGEMNNVKILFYDDLKKIIARAGKKILGKNLTSDSELI